VGGKFFIPFLGTHDECQRWSEKNSRLKELVEGNEMVIRVPSPQGSPDTGASPVAGGSAGDVEDEVLPKATDNELRRVFRGLVEGAKRGTAEVLSVLIRGVTTDKAKNKALAAKVALDEPCPYCNKKHVYHARELSCPFEGPEK
jgi:hypothetical protein